MESVLKTIAKAANLDRVLFSPALKKIYFDMAVASGGATQFKHAENIRKGLSFAVDKAEDNKNVLLFCTAYELVHGYDLLIRYAAELKPVVVLALRSGIPEDHEDNWSFLHLRETGCLQFHTHTLQETYDHLALAYHGITQKQLNLPILILPSNLHHQCLGDFTPHQDLDLGNPMTGLQTSRTGKSKMSFEEAMAKLKNKHKEKPSLRGTYDHLIETLRTLYQNLGYSLPASGLPFSGKIPQEDSIILSLIPPDSLDNSDSICYPLCYRPFSLEGIIESLRSTKKIAVVEPTPSPGSMPVFYGEVLASLGNDFKGRTYSKTYPPRVTTLTKEQVKEIKGLMK